MENAFLNRMHIICSNLHLFLLQIAIIILKLLISIPIYIQARNLSTLK